MKQQLYLGVMSGTSMDGIDIAAVRFATTVPFVDCLCVCTYDYPASLLAQLRQVATNCNTPYHTLLTLDCTLGEHLAQCVNDFISHHKIDRNSVSAIGNHGQTVQHQPQKGYSCQIGNSAIIAEHTQCTLVSDFRMSDIAAGGQGAPFICAFHQWLAQQYEQPMLFLNIGGICNITYATPDDTDTIGYDIGPGNCLLDAHIQRTLGKQFDKNGAWARTGYVQPDLLQALLQDRYFTQDAPKSTGPEYFNLAWLDTYCVEYSLTPEDIQATLVELNARLIARQTQFIATDVPLYLFGGGSHNDYLLERIAVACNRNIHTTDSIDINPNFMEAIGFAWLAKCTLTGKTNNLPAVTGAKGKRVCGAMRRFCL